MITFVVFHVELSSEGSDQQEYHKHLIARQSYDYNELCNITFRSADLFHPNCRKVLLTNMTSQFQLDDGVEIIRRDINPQNMMFERTRSQFEFLQEYDFRGNVFFLDSDMVINGSWNDVLDEEFDIALTYDVMLQEKQITEIASDGKGGYMPINGGVIIANQKNPEKARLFFERLLANYKSQQLIQHAGWWGDQHALIQTVGVDNFLKRTGDLVEAQGLKVKLLNARIYNYSPRNKTSAILRPLKAKLLHFRGDRKRLMSPYWRSYLEHKVKTVKKSRPSLAQSRTGLYLQAVKEYSRRNKKKA